MLDVRERRIPRAGTTLESVAKLKPAFKKDGTVNGRDVERDQ